MTEHDGFECECGFYTRNVLVWNDHRSSERNKDDEE